MSFVRPLLLNSESIITLTIVDPLHLFSTFCYCFWWHIGKDLNFSRKKKKSISIPRHPRLQRRCSSGDLVIYTTADNSAAPECNPRHILLRREGPGEKVERSHMLPPDERDRRGDEPRRCGHPNLKDGNRKRDLEEISGRRKVTERKKVHWSWCFIVSRSKATLGSSPPPFSVPPGRLWKLRRDFKPSLATYPPLPHGYSAAIKNEVTVSHSMILILYVFTTL